MVPIARVLMDRSGWARRAFNRMFYQYLAQRDTDGDVPLMNYGFNMVGDAPALEADDEPYRLRMQLYHRVAGAVNLIDRDVLEVGSGRGGGASYVTRYLKPRAMTGVDYAPRSVEFARAAHPVPNLSFRHGDAEDLPFDAESFDAVVNVESSHCYGSYPGFVGEVHRVLRPGGHFLWADFRDAEDIPALVDDVRAVGFTIIEEEDITAPVIESLKKLSAENLALIEAKTPAFIRPLFMRFAAVDGSEIAEGFADGSLVYLRLAAQK